LFQESEEESDSDDDVKGSKKQIISNKSCSEENDSNEDEVSCSYNLLT